MKKISLDRLNEVRGCFMLISQHEAGSTIQVIVRARSIFEMVPIILVLLKFGCIFDVGG